MCRRCGFSARPVEFFHHAFLMKSDSFLREGNCERITQVNVTSVHDAHAVFKHSCAAGPRLFCKSEAKKKPQGTQVTGSDKIRLNLSLCSMCGATSGKIHDHAHKMIAMIIISMKQPALTLLKLNIYYILLRHLPLTRFMVGFFFVVVGVNVPQEKGQA